MTQKELKELYKEELKKAWHDERMVTFCSKETAYVIEHNGFLYGIEKPKIEKDFCFGYGMYGHSTEDEEEIANEMCEFAANSDEYFVNENLRDINGMISELNDILEKMSYNWAEGSCPRYMVQSQIAYSGQDDDCKLRGFSIVDTKGFGNIQDFCDEAFITKLIEGYEQVKEDFTKRLNTYLKRYGLSKVHCWTYLVD